MPRPVSNCQFAVLTLALAGPLKSSDQTCLHGRARCWADELDADDEHP
jgi:hypothetical protein